MSIDAVIVVCAWCRDAVAGTRTKDETGGTLATGGFYEVESDEGLAETVCEPCMWADETYQSRTPYQPQDADERAAVEARRVREANRKKHEEDLIAEGRARLVRLTMKN